MVCKDSEGLLQANRKSVGPTVTDSDYEVLKQICKGDEAAFQVLYERHGLAILNYLLQIMNDRQQAEDVLQDVMLIVWEKAETFRTTGDVRGWLFGIAKRQALKTLRKNRSYVVWREETLVGDDHFASRVTQQLTLQAAILALPVIEQEALEMVYYRGMTLEAVAVALNVPLNTVKTRLYRARQRLRDYFKEDAPDHAR